MNKKGMEAYYLVGLLLVIAGLIVIIFIYNSIKGGIESGTDSEVCRQSVLASRTSKFISLGTGNPLENLKCITKNKFFVDETSENIKRELVKDIYDCSYQYWDGKLDFTDFWSSILSQKNYCLVCYIEKTSNEFKISAQDLRDEVAKAGTIKDLLLEGDAKTVFTMSKDQDLLISFYIAKRSTGMQSGIVIGKPEDIKKKCEVYAFKQKGIMV
ncbi:hypothetical protein HYV88_04610 [Candidatus Woesearchaeota archaeon]|nr:hypothetical protein [Candidatus Woesearchaeota archaeon]